MTNLYGNIFDIFTLRSATHKLVSYRKEHHTPHHKWQIYVEIGTNLSLLWTTLREEDIHKIKQVTSPKIIAKKARQIFWEGSSLGILNIDNILRNQKIIDATINFTEFYISLIKDNVNFKLMLFSLLDTNLRI